MKIVQLTTDNRNHHGRHDVEEPYFGTAPEGLFQGFAEIPEVEVHVISCTSRPMAAPEKLAPNIFFHQPVVPKLGWGRSLFLGCAWATRGMIRKINPDIVHGQGTERDCSMEAVLSGYPNVMTIHGNMRVHATRKEQKGIHYYKVAAALEGWCLKRTDGVVAISDYTRSLVEPLNRNTWLLPNAADKRYFDIVNTPPAVPRILFVGSLGERKNSLGLVEACEPVLRAGRCTLAFAGEGHPSPYNDALTRLISSLPGVEMLGFIGRDELARELALSTMLVLPTFEDNCPMVVLEAMAAGVPVAASAVGGIPDLILHEKDGLLFDPSAAGAVRAAISRLLDEPDLRERLSRAGKETALHRFHPRIVAAEHIRIYQEVLGRQRHR